jgi:hypothetical protein
MQLAGHAIGATLVATVGNRDAEIRNTMAMSILHVARNFTVGAALNQGSGTIDSLFRGCMIFHMKRQIFSRALTLGIAASAVILTGCSTTESRISEHPEIFQTLSPNDQALVSRGQIRAGMSQNAVWLAWGAPEQKAVGNMRGRGTETWIYMNTTTYPYYRGYGYPYGPYGYGYGFARVGVVRTHRHSRFVFFGDPFYDPFYYSYIPPSISYPYKTVTFANGRVMSFQYLVPPYR